MRLYVKSEKMDLVEYTMPHQTMGGHYCSAGYRTKGVMRKYTLEDEEAIKYLTSNGFSFDLIDLSDCSSGTKLKAKISRINKTPSLILDNGTKIKGIEQIREYLKTCPQNLQKNNI